MKISKLILLIVLVQICLLINSPIANSYRINDQDKLIDKKIEERNVFGKVLESGINLIIGFLSIKQIGSVSAQEINVNCCLEKSNGEKCVEIVEGQSNDCSYELIGGECSSISSCEAGCCIDEVEGLCTPNTIKQTCLDSGGKWDSEESCAITDCQKGCCVLGEETQFIEESRCERVSALYGFEEDFRQSIKYELDCLALMSTEERGACVYEENRCEITTEKTCDINKGKFYSGILCSHPEVNSSCEKQFSVGCYSGRDEIYWFDSCGNRENIYDSDKEKSWNNGEVLSKEESCGASESNANSKTCGNCQYVLGSYCSESGSTKVNDGNFICKDMDCVDENGRARKNGESWCVYDGYIGDGKDVVGSRHWVRMCLDGEILAEGCSDYRTGLCVQTNVQNEETGECYSMASCAVNEADICMSYNGEEDMIGLCDSNNMCTLKQIDIDDGFKFEVCVGAYPKGFDLSYEDGSSDEAKVCAWATQNCTVIYEKKAHSKDLLGGSAYALKQADWECIYNCQCEEEKFGLQLHNLCISLGDCGSYVNYIGAGTDNTEVIESPDVSWTDYVSYAIPVLGKYAEPNDYSDYLLTHSSVGDIDTSDLEEAYEYVYEALDTIGKIQGGVAGLIQLGSWMGIIETSQAVLNTAVFTEGGKMINVVNTGFGNFMAASATAAIFAVAVSYLIEELGLQGQGAMILSVLATVGSISISLAVAFSLKAAAFCGPGAIVCFAILLAIIAIIGVILKAVGIGDTKEVIVQFECYPWEAPLGGKDCHICNENSLKPCTKYRCESLGQACRLINEDSENPTCEAIPDNHRPATISPDWIDYGFSFVNEKGDYVRIETDKGECIPEFYTLKFGLKTDEPAQCKYELQRTNSYDDMTNYPLELNLYGTDHTFGFMIPSIESLSDYGITGDIRQMFSNLTMFVRCQDYYGDINTKEYSVNFCVTTGEDFTPAYITKYSPSDESYLPYGVGEKEVVIHLSEPAECRYDKEDRNYEIMLNTMQCETDVTKFDADGWKCNSKLTGLNNLTNSIYIKCKDQPWFAGTENESKRNINTDGYKYTLYKSESELKIDSIIPEGEIEIGFTPFATDFEVKTSGGAQDGIAICYYNFDNSNKKSLFESTGGNQHKQNINQLMRGDYTFYVFCEDVAGNMANSSTQIKIKVDERPPEIVRAYEEYGMLIVQTDERAECYYSPTKCLFDINNATSMTTGYSTEHSTPWNAGETYHIKCIDIWGNKPDDCTIRLLPNFFISLILNKFINENILKIK